MDIMREFFACEWEGGGERPPALLARPAWLAPAAFRGTARGPTCPPSICRRPAPLNLV